MALAGWKTGRLPLREGVDLNFSVVDLRTPTICLPLREGVDLNRK